MAIRMVVTDLDGTLLKNDSTVGSNDLETLTELGNSGVVRVAATGRSIYTAAQVLEPNFPIDYLVFSTGSGVMEWKSKELVVVKQLEIEEVNFIAQILVANQFDFMIHEAIPKNHMFQFHASGNPNPDFQRRCEHYRGFSTPFIPGVYFPEASTQILIILRPDQAEREVYVRNLLKDFSIIKATSPFDKESIWLEIFPVGVSKAHGIDCISNLTGIMPSEIVAVGNDYNDLEMLDHAAHSYVVANAPSDMLERYKNTESNEHSGFSKAVAAALVNENELT